MPPAFTEEVQLILRQASQAPLTKRFTCNIFNPEWNQFVELWAPRIYTFVEHALGPYGTAPKSTILKISDGFHAAGANASFDIESGQIRLAITLEGKPGVLLEKLTHEMTHGSLSKFPEGDVFYEEGWIDYTIWVMAHAPCWEPYRDDMLKAASDNIKIRRERALKTGSDYDRKRWTGGFYASMAFGPHIIASLRSKKEENNLVW
jgi:hypothetical protein